MKKYNLFLAVTCLLLFVFVIFILPGICSDNNISLVWDRVFGGENIDYATTLIQTSDGGYAVAGTTYSYGAGGRDFWVIKLDNEGNKVWDKTFGGNSCDCANSLIQTTDGGYAVAGETYSYGAGNADFWIIKLDSSGNKKWDKTYGGSDGDYATSLIQTTDGGYAVVGETCSFGAGGRDLWVVKLDNQGNREWDKTLGTVKYDYANALIQTTDGGYAVAGGTESYSAGSADFWVIKLDNQGNREWEKTFGGSDWDMAYSLIQTKDGGYAVAGGIFSYGEEEEDFWVIKLDINGKKVWDKTFGGSSWDIATALIQTKDGGYAVAGITESFGAGGGDFWVIKLDINGKKVWDKTFGGSNDDSAWSLIQADDGCYLVAGGASFNGTVRGDFWIIKFSEEARYGTIFITSNPPEANIYFGSEDKGSTPITLNSIISDFYFIKITKTGYENWTKKIKVFAGKTTNVSADLEPIFADIELTDIPSGARLYLDDKRIYAKSILEQVPFGKHKIKITKLFYITQTKNIDIISSEKVTISIPLVSVRPLFLFLTLAIVYCLFLLLKRKKKRLEEKEETVEVAAEKTKQLQNKLREQGE